MLICFTCILSRSVMIMAFYSRSFIPIIRGMENHSRPFDEFLASSDAASNAATLLDDNDCKSSRNSSTRFTWTNGYNPSVNLFWNWS